MSLNRAMRRAAKAITKAQNSTAPLADSWAAFVNLGGVEGLSPEMAAFARKTFMLGANATFGLVTNATEGHEHQFFDVMSAIANELTAEYQKLILAGAPPQGRA